MSILAGPAERTVAERNGPRTGLVALGVIVLVAGSIATLLLWLAADDRYDDGVTGLARAPVGCDTVLDFDEAGEYLVFVETTGRIAELRGDCDTPGAYDLPQVPSVDVLVTDPDGAPLEVVPVTGVDYDRAGFEGVSLGTITVTEATDHVIRVQSDAGGFAVAVGRDPHDGVGLLRTLAVAAGAVAGVLGLALVVLGLRGHEAAPRTAPGGGGASGAPPPLRPWPPTGPPTAPRRAPPPPGPYGSGPTEDAPGPSRAPAGPPTRIPGDPLAPGPRPLDSDRSPVHRPATAEHAPPPAGPRLTAPGPSGSRRAPLPPPGGGSRRPDEVAEHQDRPPSPWAPPDR